MSIISTGIDHHSGGYRSQPRGFLTPPPMWHRGRCFPAISASEKKPENYHLEKSDLFHVIHKVYVRAKHVQLIERNPSQAISLFWAAINSGDRVDSALKDMTVVMKQLDRSNEAIEAIKSFRHLSTPESQESLDNILIELYKQSGRIDEEIEMLQLKLKQVEEGIAFGGKRTKMARSQGKKIQVTVEKEYSRLLGNLAWAYMQKQDYKSAEEHYRKALSLESDKNKQCNLALCLIHQNKSTEAKFLLQAIKFSCEKGRMNETDAKSYDRATQMLFDLESNSENIFQKGENLDWRRKEKEGSGSKRLYMSPFGNGRFPKVPFSQPRKCFYSVKKRDQIKSDGGFCRKLPFSQPVTEQNLKQYDEKKRNDTEERDISLESHLTAGFSKFKENLTPTEKIQEKASVILTCESKKSWADMVEEEEEEEKQRNNWDMNNLPENSFQESLFSYQILGNYLMIQLMKKDLMMRYRS